MTTWSIKVDNTKFVSTADGELTIEFEDGNESPVFLSMQKQLQASMMKSARKAHPVKTVPAPLPPSPRNEKMPATPIVGPGAGAPSPVHKTMPVRPPMSPSAIRPKKGPPSPSYGRLMHETRVLAEKRNREEGGLPVTNNHVIPNSYERLTSEVSARHAHAIPVNEETTLTTDDISIAHPEHEHHAGE